LSEIALAPTNRTWPYYGAAALVAAFEMFVGWQALHPDVPANYRAYYLDQSTTCLDQPVSGDYAFGTEISFRSGSEKLVKPLKVCGWEGPVGDGLHAVGESSRLRFALPSSAYRLRLMLEMVAVDKAAPAGQPVTVVANGTTLGTVRVLTGEPQRFSFAVPDAALDSKRALDVELKFPQAIRVNPQDSDTRKRSIKLSAGRVTD
jgi:hypothetical protein